MEHYNFISNSPTNKLTLSIIPIDQSVRLINKLLIKTELLITNLQITKEEFSLAYSNFYTFTKVNQIINIRTIYQFKGKLNFQHVDSIKIVKLFLILLYLILVNQKQDLDIKDERCELLLIYLKYIYKIFINGFLSSNEISILSRYILLLSVVDFNHRINNELISYKIKHYNFAKRAFHILVLISLEKKRFIATESIEVVDNFLDFFIEKFLSEKENITLIIQQGIGKLCITDFMQIITKVSIEKQDDLKNKIINMISILLENNFSYKNLMIPFIWRFKHLLINLKQKDIDVLYQDLSIADCPISLVMNIIKKEKGTLKEKDPFQLKHGFYLNSKSACVSVNGVKINKNKITIIFGFKLEPKNKNKINYTIISFIENQNTWRFAIGIKYNKKANGFFLNIQEVNREKDIDTEIKIEPMKSYVFIASITIEKKKIKIIFNYSNPIETHTYEFESKLNGECYILGGSTIKNEEKITTLKDNIQSDFTGELGTIIVLNTLLSNELISNILNLKGRYEDFLNFHFISKSLLDKYSIKNDLLYNTVLANIKELTNREKGKDKTYLDKILCIISPKRFQFQQFDPYEKENFIISKGQKLPLMKATSNNTPNKIELYSNFHPGFHLFENKITLIEFLKCKGISFICLIFEYYYQVLVKINLYTNDNNQSDNCLISTTIPTEKTIVNNIINKM